jgi:hypothetical protein
VLSFVYLHNVQILDKSTFFVLDTRELLVPEVQRYGMKTGLTKTAAVSKQW